MRACPACNSRYGEEVIYCVKDGSAVVVDAAVAAQVAAADALVGQIIADRYELKRKLGEGGMGEVYEAQHIHIEKRVALKLLRPEVLSNQEAVTRFRQEARSASSIGHENIIEIDDFGTLPDGRVYLTMEFLDGAPLSDLIKQPIDLGRGLAILIQTAHGLAAAHAKGIVHRDMKPENVFVTRMRDGREVPKILDFGIAKVSGADSNQNLTRTGTIFGTPFYMAPEQALGQGIDHRADIYAMGVILYEVFAGTVPFRAESFMGILTQHITAQAVPPSQVAAASGRFCPPELEAVILQAMQKNPDERIPTMNALIDALTAVYRQYVGAGMTTPMPAPPMSPSQFMPAQGYAPMAGAGMSQVAMPVGPGTHAYGIPASASMAAAEPPARGKGLVIAAVAGLLVLGGGGAAGWYFLFGPGKSEAEAVATAPAAPDAATKPVTDPPKDENKTTQAGTTGTDGLPTSGTGGGTPVAPAVDAAPVAPAPKERTVLVDSLPRGATIYDGEESLGKTPTVVRVKEGTPVSLRLALRGHADASVTLDGTDETPAPVKLERIVKDTRKTGGGKTGGGKTGGGKTGGGKTGGSTGGNTGNDGVDGDELE